MFKAERAAPGAVVEYGAAENSAAAEYGCATVRHAVPADLDALVALERHFPTDRLSRASLRRLIGGGSADVIVHEVAGKAVANVVVLYRRNSRRARIYSLVVHPGHHGRGIASALLDAVKQRVRRRACTVVSLEVRTDNAPALRLYQKAGFHLVRQITDYYQDHAPALRLEKRVASSKK